MAVVVQKYGGGTLESIDRFRVIAEQISERKNQGDTIVAVLSSMGKTTDYLLEMAYELSSEPDGRELAALLSAGEQVSIALLSIALNSIGARSVSFMAQQLDIRSEGTYSNSRIIDINHEKIAGALENDSIVIVAGFQGINEYNEITTLGRGGSDVTAVALCARLGAVCEIYSDVDGVYTIDPKLYPSARRLDHISYEEMLEIASSGSSVIQPQAIELAEKYSVPLIVSHYTSVSQNKSNVAGTVIKELENSMQRSVITGLAVDNDEAMITLNGIPHDIKTISEIFQGLADRDINIDMISQTTPASNLVTISFTLPGSELKQAVELLEEFKKRLADFSYEAYESITKMSVVGLGMNSQPGVAARMFNILAENDIQIHTITTSEIKISFVVAQEDQQKAVVAIAKEFDL